MRKYKCYMCEGLFNAWVYRKDSSPRGDDESVCPLCGAVECGGSVVEVEEWIILPDFGEGDKVVHEVKCPICKYQETYMGDNVPERCYICEQRLVRKAC